MAGLVGFVALLAVVVWLIGRRRPRLRSMPAPEDDVKTPIDHAALEEAERELNDPRVRPLYERLESEDADDWGPGTR